MVAATAVAVAPAADAGCFDFCGLNAYNSTDGSILYSWDLRSLCNNGSGHTFNNGSTQYRFEICGTLDPIVPELPVCVGDGVTPCQVSGSAQTNSYCNPEYNAHPNAGSFMQFFDPNPATTCYYGPTSGAPAPGNLGGCPNTGNGTLAHLPNYCCTGQCEVLAASASSPSFRVDDANMATGGIQWTEYGAAPNLGDEFQCPIDPGTGYPRVRSVSVTIDCNPSGNMSDPLVVNQAYDVTDCRYRFVMMHKAACGVPGSSGGGGGGSGGDSGGGNSQADTKVGLPNLEVGISAGLVLAGAAAALAAVVVVQQVRARCGTCRLPRVTVSIKYGDEEGEGAHSALLGTAYATTTSTPPLRSLGR